MDLDFNQDQVLLKDSVSRMCSQFSNLEEVRSLEGTEPGYSQLFWQQLKDLGITGMNISEDYGGLAMDLFDSLIVYEETLFIGFNIFSICKRDNSISLENSIAFWCIP